METNPWLRLGRAWWPGNACSSGYCTRSKVGGKGLEGNRKEGRPREKEACLDELPSPFPSPSPSPEVGCPTLPKVQCSVTAGRG